MGLGGYHAAVVLAAGAMLIYLSYTQPDRLAEHQWVRLAHLGEYFMA